MSKQSTGLSVPDVSEVANGLTLGETYGRALETVTGDKHSNTVAVIETNSFSQVSGNVPGDYDLDESEAELLALTLLAQRYRSGSETTDEFVSLVSNALEQTLPQE